MREEGIMRVGLSWREIEGGWWYKLTSILWVKLEWWGWRCRRWPLLYRVLSEASWYVDKARWWGE